jgi:hypothetical protein
MKNQDTSSTGVLNMIFGFVGELLLKFLVAGACIGAVVVGIGYLIFH